MTRWSVLAVLVLGVLSGGAFGEDYPTRPVRIIVPYPAGGAADLLTRVVAQKLTESLGVQVVVEDRPGAGGNIGAELVAKAPPDGYVLLMGNASTLAINASLFKQLPYDPSGSFAPISLVAEVPLILTVNPATPFRTVQELIAAARAKPGSLNYGLGGNGSTTHLGMELFKSMAGVQIVGIPFAGSAPAVAATVAGETQVMLDLIPSSIAQVKAGQLRALAISTARRSDLMPDLPTIAEAGVPGFQVSSWFGLVAPAQVPSAVLDRLSTAVIDAVKAPDLRARFVALGADAVSSTPAQFRAFIRAELDKWAAVVRQSGAHIE